jgi:Zn-dependent protease with chaperone function
MIHLDPKALTAVLCCQLLLLPLIGCGGRRTTLPTTKPTAAVFGPLQEDLKKSYATLFEIAPTLEYSPRQIEQMREYLKQAQDYCVGSFERQADQYDYAVQEAQKGLKKAKISAEERHNLHCTIQNSRGLKNQADVIAQHAIPVAYDNKQAKLDLIQQWPAQLVEIRQSVASGVYKNRRWGDVEDIGFRDIESDQKDDIKMGQDAIQQLKRTGLLPKEVEDPAVVDYVRGVAKKIAANSDLQIPLVVSVLNSKEINAFALPGGYIFIERGLLEAADDESQLAGVISHEMSHDVLRHGHKLMRKATIASIIYQAAQVAAVIFTGGAAGIGTYYALQYGFFGLGMALNLSLLGVSRDFELQADQLGIQYAWKSGYDPSGYVRFFDKMATKEGYVNGASWFRSHPPFYQRMVDAEREIAYLPKKEHFIVNTAGFKTMKDALAKVTAKAAEEEKGQPSLLAPEQGCPAPAKLIFEPNQPIETICGQPQTQIASAR